MINDEFFLGKALVEAEKSLEKKEVPVGAILISGNKILSRGHNELTWVRIPPSPPVQPIRTFISTLFTFQKKLFYNFINFNTFYIRHLLNFGLKTDTQT